MSTVKCGGCQGSGRSRGVEETAKRFSSFRRKTRVGAAKGLASALDAVVVDG